MISTGVYISFFVIMEPDKNSKTTTANYESKQQMV